MYNGLLKPKRKVFISYYHRDDQYYKNRFLELFGHIIIDKSVGNGDISTDVSTEYVKQLIQGDYLRDASVVVVLCGPNTWGRKHVDWEISGGLDKKLDGCSGLLGIILPEYHGYSENKYYSDTIPERLAKNLESGYAKMYQWTEDVNEMQRRIEEAFNNRTKANLIFNKSIIQKQRNTSGI